MAQEKAEIATELYARFEKERVTFDDELKEERGQRESLEEQTRNLRFSLESFESRCNHYE